MKTTFVQKADNYIQTHNLLSKGDSVVLGVSGGADSVALFVTLNELKVKYDLKLFVVHINHGLRVEAKAEAEYVKSLCAKENVPFILKETDVAKLAKSLSMGTEEAGRKFRYEAFNEVLKNMGGGKIAVAHNKNDRAETMLFNLFRGTGPKGLQSINPVRDNIIRPLLCMERREIEDFLNEKGISYCTDASNFSDEYSRNRIRNNLIPLIRESISNEAIAHMATTADQLGELNDFANRVCENAFSLGAKVEKNKVEFDKKLLLQNDIYIQKLLIKRAIDELVPRNKDITHTHIEDVIKILEKDGTKRVNLPYDITAVSSYETLVMKKGREEKPEEKAEIFIKPGMKVEFPGGYTVITELESFHEGYEHGENQYTKCFDYDKINESLVLRTRQTGDEIVVNKSGGRKKLKDYMIDEKIPVDLRDGIPLLCTRNKVLWVIGYRMSEEGKISDSTRSVLKVTVFKEDI